MVKLPPPLWALIYLIVCAGLSRGLGWPMLPGPSLAWLGVALVLAGFVPALWAVRLFRRDKTELDPTSPANRKLVTDGPYRFTRNPMYLGLVIITLGVALWSGAWPMFLAPVAVFATANWLHIPYEEAKMRHQFGGAFDDYARRVRRWA